MFEMARSLHLNRFERVRKITLPALLPSIFLGVRVAAPVALVITLLVEILTQVDGVGALIAQSQRNYEFAQGYGLILVAACSHCSSTRSCPCCKQGHAAPAANLTERTSCRNRPD